MTVIGLTGGIASGKSSVTQIAAELGAHVIDADRLGHRVYEPQTAGFDAVVAAFGPDIVSSDGAIDRRQLGAKVFADPSELKRLTDIVWPEIRRLALEEIDRTLSDDSDTTVVLEAAVLLEAGWNDIVDELWVVTVPRDVAIERAVSRDGVDRDAIEARLDAQLGNEERTAQADVVIDNSGTVDDLANTVKQHFSKYSSGTPS